MNRFKTAFLGLVTSGVIVGFLAYALKPSGILAGVLLVIGSGALSTLIIPFYNKK